MSESSTFEDEIEIKILGESENPYDLKVNEKQEPLQTVMETVTSNNWSQHFPDTPLTPENKEELENGLLYLKVAIDSKTGAKAGSVEVRHQQDNALTVDVVEEYQRRGIASVLIKQAQDDHNNLHLLNFAGKAGENLYIKMGFKPEGGIDHFVWKKEV